MATSDRRLNLLFPDWQSCGRDLRASAGARLLRTTLAASLEFAEVPVDRDPNLALQQDILGRSVILEQLREARSIVHRSGADRIFTLAGTCGAEVIPVSYLSERYHGDLAVLWLDAHGDLNVPANSPSKHFHGMPLRVLLGEGDPEILECTFGRLISRQIALVGVRALDPAESEFIERNDLLCVGPTECRTVSDVALSVCDLGFRHLYIHFDVDALDPAAFPWALFPEAGGLPPAFVASLLRRICEKVELVGFSIVEAVPDDSAAAAERLRPIYEILDSALG